MRGKFELFEEVDGNLYGKKIAESYNRMMYDGMEFVMDFAFGVESWFSGSAGYDGDLPASGAWNPYRYVAIGYSADNNNGWLASNGYITTGSAEGTGSAILEGTGIKIDVVTTGANLAYFPDLDDSVMTSMDPSKGNKNVGSGLFYKLADRIVRTGRTITIEATFTTDIDQENGDSNTIPTGTKIRELGIFLGIPTGAISPSTNRVDRPSSVIAKSVRYLVSGGFIQDNPITAGANNLTVRYTYGDAN
jgi:hypothetical protein